MSDRRPIRRTARRTPRRRGRTRWLLVTPTLLLVGIIAGAYWLESVGPEAPPQDLRVDGVPPLVSTEERECTRRDRDTVADELRDNFPEAGRLSSTQVFLCPRAFDGLRVTYVGEVVGDILPRDGGAWVQVNDDRYALEVGPLVGHRERDGFNTGLAVWLPEEYLDEVEQAGRPGRRGDVILVRGTLFRADPDDGGGVTIRAEELEVLSPSVEVEDPLHVPQLVVAIVLGLLAIGGVAWSRWNARRF